MSETHKPTILVVDDDPLDRDLFRKLLEGAGYAVVEAGSGKEALNAIVNTSLDLIVLDLNMPEMDGLELLRVAKNMPKPKVIAVTGLTPVLSERILEAARLLGAAATLDKFWARDLMVPVVRRLLGDSDREPGS
jgi:two-component system, chemotaxis family, chemotaxis protein CheY